MYNIFFYKFLGCWLSQENNNIPKKYLSFNVKNIIINVNKKGITHITVYFYHLHTSDIDFLF